METRTIKEYRLSKVSKAFLLILLLLVGIYSFCFIQDQTVSFVVSGISILVIIVFIFYQGVRNKMKHKHIQQIIQHTQKVNAKILAVKSDMPKIIILQLMIGLPGKEYITSLIIDKSEENIGINYKAGQDLPVFIDPENPHNIVIPEANQEKPYKKRFNWFKLIFISGLAATFITPICLPFLSDIFDHSGRVFKDIAFIQVDDKQENIWEVRYKSPDKIFISIYDPLTNKKIKIIKDKKEMEMDFSADFFIIQQNQKVFIIATGTAPVLDIYDAITFEKFSDIKKFEESNIFFNKGISEIQNVSLNDKFVTDNIFEITTNDGNKCYYDIPDNKFYHTESHKTIYTLLSRQMFIFVLSFIPDAVEKHQLYIIKTTDEKGITILQGLAGSYNLNVDYFNKNKDSYYKYCELVPLCNDQYFLKGRIKWLDSSMVIIQHATAINKEAEVLFSGIDIKGKTLFTIKQGDYPNIDKMTEDSYLSNDYRDTKIVRANNKIVFLFGKYGGLCVDVKTGEILWKLEL